MDNTKSIKPRFINRIWYWDCYVCCRKYYNEGSHKNCYKRSCCICQLIFDSNQKNKEHALLIHPEFFCHKCNQSYKYIDNHFKFRKCI